MKRRLLIAAAVLGGLVLVLVVGYHFALQRLHGALLQALGPRATVGAIELNWNRLEIRDLRIRAERESRPRWPAEDELRAQRVELVPDLRGLFSGPWRVGRVVVDKPYLSLYRSRDGKLHVLPALLDKPTPPQKAAQETAAPPLVLIERVQLIDAEVELFDASVRQPAHRLRLAELQADVQDLKLPALDEPLQLDIDAVFKGPQRDGRLKIDGTLTPATHDAKLKAEVRGVDLVALEPYLLKVAEGGVKRGSLDLKLDATVQQNQLKAPGTLTLRQLELKDAQFAGIPRRAVLAAMSRDDKIEVQFTLAGRLDDPSFSLNEVFALRVTAALAEKLGVSVGGVVEGVGSVIKGLLGK